MAAIPLYNRLKNFLQYALDHVSAPYNAADHDAELNAVEQTLDGLTTNIALIQRNDGLLANNTVHPDAFTTPAKALIGAGSTGNLNWIPRGLWVTVTAYALGNVVEQAGTSYVCAVAHTSGTFATDKTAGKWVTLGGLIITLAASAVTNTPAGNIAATDVQAALNELDTEKAKVAGDSAQTFLVNTPANGNQAPRLDTLLKQTASFMALAAAVADVYTGTISLTSLSVLSDAMEVAVRFPSANGSSTPTFELTLGATATGAKTIVNEAGGALKTSDIAANMEARLRYRLSTDKWVLLARVGLPVPGAAATVLTSAGPAAQPVWQGIPVTATLAGTRQTVLAAKLDSSGYNAALAAGSGLSLDLSATAAPMVTTFAGGFNEFGALDYATKLIADAAAVVSGLSNNNTSFVYQDFVSSSSVNWSKGLVPPQYGYAFDRARHALLNFEAADASVAMIDDFGNTWTPSGNAQIDTAQKQFGNASLLLDGTGDFITSTNFTTLGEGSWEISAWFRPNAFSANSVHIIASLENASGFGAILSVDDTAGARRMRMLLSSNGTSHDIASVGTGATAINTATWYKARLVFDALAGTYRVYLSVAGAAESQELTVSSTSRICAVTKAQLGFNGGGGSIVAWNGWIDAFRLLPCATNTTTETPSGVAPVITDYPVHFFSIPEMKMYEVTAASVAAGVNPTTTSRTRACVAECDTSGGNVSAVRNYMLRGKYRDQRAFPAQNTVTSLNHNVGTAFVTVRTYAAIKTVIDSPNYPVGALVPLYNTRGDPTVPRGGAFVAAVRNSVKILNDSQGGISIGTQNGSTVAVTPAAADLVTEVERTF